MATTRITDSSRSAFLERFGWFEDGVITGVCLHLPRRPAAGRSAAFDIQAMDRLADSQWRLVRITIGGLYEYQLPCSKQYSYFVLSDGLNLDCSITRCLLDLDPGPDEWSPDQVAQHGEYSKQYAIGDSCEYEVLDGPFI